MTDQSGLSGLSYGTAPDGLCNGAAIVAVGELDLWRKVYGKVPSYRGLQFIALRELDKMVGAGNDPDLILSPVLAPTFDCLEVAHCLSQLRYQGAYRALYKRIPNPAIIRREVCSAFPILDFDLMPLHPSVESPA